MLMCRNQSVDVGISSYIHHEVNTRPTNETQEVLGNGDVKLSGVRKGGSGRIPVPNSRYLNSWEVREQFKEGSSPFPSSQNDDSCLIWVVHRPTLGKRR